MMNKNLILREPTYDDMHEYLAFLKEWGHEKNVTPYAATLRGDDYLTFVDILRLREIGEYDKEHLVPDLLYILVDEKNHIYGALNLRLTLNDYLLKYGGHIGYGIRPSERGKGYGTYMLERGLELAKSRGFDKVLITCDEDNIASERVILKNGGILENKIYKHDGYILRYWVPTKALEQVSKFAILIAGQLASYKSTIAKRLSKDLGVVTYIKDEMKEALADAFEDPSEKMLSRNLSKAVFELMKQNMINTLNTHQHVIIESNFKFEEFIEIKLLAEKMRIYLFLVFCTGDTEVLYKRYINREHDRHPTHLSHGALNFDTFESVCKNRNQLLSFNPYVLDTTDFNDESYETLLQTIKDDCGL